MSERRRAHRTSPGRRALGGAVGLALVLLGLALGLQAAGSAGAGGKGGSLDALAEMLSGIDFVPDRLALDQAMGGDAAAQLIAIAGGTSSLVDPGVRIRAYRALALYPSSEARTALAAAVTEFGSEERGVATIYLRAAMDSLAQIAGAGAVTTIAPMLDHVSRDVRASAARALGVTESVTAVAPLNDRRLVEQVPQVRLAIDDALRELTENTPGTKEVAPAAPAVPDNARSR
jgi:HEAT repeat protein